MPGDSIPEFSSPKLAEFYELWRSKRRETEFPPRSAFPIDVLRPWIGNILLVDVRHDPLSFIMRLEGTALVAAKGLDFTGKCLNDVDLTGYEPDILSDYEIAVRERRPVCRVRTFTKKVRDLYSKVDWSRYERLLLPLATDGHMIDMLMGCSYPLDARADML